MTELISLLEARKKGDNLCNPLYPPQVLPDRDTLKAAITDTVLRAFSGVKECLFQRKSISLKDVSANCP